MKEEIKEILDNLKQHISIISVEDEDLLLDYITNLQEENVVLKSQLLQDNKSYHDMQDRIKKAIEYINTVKENTIDSTRKNFAKMILINYEDLLNILKGEDKE